MPAPNALSGNRRFSDIAAETVSLSAPVRVAVVDARGVIQAHVDLPAATYTVAGIRDAVNAALGAAATASAADGGGLSITAADPAHGIAILDLAGAALERLGGSVTVEERPQGGVVARMSLRVASR